MKTCINCGSQITDDTVVCPYCGASQPQPQYQQPVYQQPPVYQQSYYGGFQNQESSALSICAIIFACIIPLIGLILGLIGLSNSVMPENKNRSKIAVIISSVLMGLALFSSIFLMFLPLLFY